MLDQRRRRWADVVQMLCKCFVFAGTVLQTKQSNFLLYLPYREGETYRFTSHRSFLCHISFVHSVLSVYHAGGQTPDVNPMSGYCWPTVYDAEPTLAQYWVTVSSLTPHCMWASVIDEGQN